MFILSKNIHFLRNKIPITLITSNKSLFCTLKKKSFKEKQDEYILSKNKGEVLDKVENEYFIKQMIDITKYNKFVRFPIYLPIFPLILMNPLSYSFSVLLYTEVFYLISVTCLEGASLFSMGLYNYKTVSLKDETEMSSKMAHYSANRKRIFLPFFFFGLIFLSLSMLNQNKICGSLYTLIFAHAYLYYKFAIQIVMKICPETFIYNSMSFLGSSTCVILLLICIYKSKQSIVKSSL